MDADSPRRTAAALDVFTIPVHPAAEVAPMLSPEELAELAEDIRANGLLHPLVVKAGILIDGRNRREACRMLGIVPPVVELAGFDTEDGIKSYVVGCEKRRHRTKGQIAIWTAMLFPEPARYRRGGKANASATEGLTSERLSAARTVLRWAPELADAVLKGARSLDSAYEVAQDHKRQAEAPAQRLAALRALAPDLADKVVEEGLDIVAAEDQQRGRAERERTRRQGVYDGLQSIDSWKFLLSGENADYLISICREHPEELNSETLLSTFADIRAAFDYIEKGLR